MEECDDFTDVDFENDESDGEKEINAAEDRFETRMDDIFARYAPPPVVVVDSTTKRSTATKKTSPAKTVPPKTKTNASSTKKTMVQTKAKSTNKRKNDDDATPARNKTKSRNIDVSGKSDLFSRLLEEAGDKLALIKKAEEEVTETKKEIEIAEREVKRFEEEVKEAEENKKRANEALNILRKKEDNIILAKKFLWKSLVGQLI